MNPQQIQPNDWIFASAIFGEKAYKVFDVIKIGEHCAEIKTGYGTATFSLLLGENNWRYAVQSDLGQ